MKLFPNKNCFEGLKIFSATILLQTLRAITVTSLASFSLLRIPAAYASSAQPALVKWEGWSDDIFERAKKSHKLVILDMEAVWCHWCHVMDEQTYRDPNVVKLLETKFIAVKVDQDSRPDLSNRYENWGWPATIIFDENGQELIKRAGYIPPSAMASLLQAVIDDPTPGPSVQKETEITYASSPLLTEDLRKTLKESFFGNYDIKEGSWGKGHKLLDWDSTEYAMRLASQGDEKSKKMATQTLDQQMKLLDPAWGGVYQYSTDGDWVHPHFEKIMQMQAENLRIYSLGHLQFDDAKYLKAAREIERFLTGFLTSKDGAFYTSQDADLEPGKHSEGYFKLNDAARRKKGIPRIDKSIYTRENGWAIYGMAALYAATGDAKVLEKAERAAKWIDAHRKSPEGKGYFHGEKSGKLVFLGDQIAIARAFLALYSVTGTRDWLTKATDTLDFAAARFANNVGGKPTGYFVSTQDIGLKQKPQIHRDENIAVARTANLAFRLTGKDSYKAMSEGAMRYLASPEVADRFLTGGILLTAEEIASEPLHLTIVGPKKDPQSLALYQKALAFSAPFKMTEWWDKSEGPMPRSDVTYPELKKPAAFVCSGTRCSLPITDADKLPEKVRALSKQ